MLELLLEVATQQPNKEKRKDEQQKSVDIRWHHYYRG